MPNRMRPTRYSRRTLAYTALILTLASLGIAQAQPSVESPKAVENPKKAVGETPEVVAQKLFACASRGDWSGYARLMHPTAMVRLKQMFRPIVGADKETGSMMFGVSSVAQYDKLTGVQLLERLMRGLEQSSPDFKVAVRGAQYAMIGHLEEAPDLAHVVYRTTFKSEGVSITETAVISLQKYEDEWRGLLSGDIEGLAAVLGRLHPTTKAAPKSSAKSSTKSKPGTRPKTKTR